MSSSTITELDLSTCHPNSIVNRINAVPGLKSSTGTFNYFLKTFYFASLFPITLPYTRSEIGRPSLSSNSKSEEDDSKRIVAARPLVTQSSVTPRA